MNRIVTSSAAWISHRLGITRAGRRPALCSLFLASVVLVGGFSQTTSAQSSGDQQTATVLVQVDTSRYSIPIDPDLAWLWFHDEVVGILRWPNANGSNAVSCNVAGFEGTYTTIDATLVTRHGGLMFAHVLVKADVALDSTHGFWPAGDFGDVDAYQLVNNGGVISTSATGDIGFFVSIGL